MQDEHPSYCLSLLTCCIYSYVYSNNLVEVVRNDTNIILVMHSPYQITTVVTPVKYQMKTRLFTT